MKERLDAAQESATSFLIPDGEVSRGRAGLLFIESYRELPLLTWPRKLIDAFVELEESMAKWRPVSWQERGTYFTPMNEGLRVGGVVEFGGKTKDLNPKVINFLQRTAKSLFPDLKKHYSEWVGGLRSSPSMQNS